MKECIDWGDILFDYECVGVGSVYVCEVFVGGVYGFGAEV